ncbi:MAG: hypothetical protein ACE15F_15080 [bacterium]
MKLLEWLDANRFLGVRIWDFSFRSLLRVYGRDFMKSVILRHPVQTFHGIRRYRRLENPDASGEYQSDFDKVGVNGKKDGQRVIGVGFCLKPLHPGCVSGRGNHNCFYLEQNLHREPEPGAAVREIPACCKSCVIKDIGLLSLASGCVFYIMTSARDILYDLILPSLEKGRFSRGLFVICRYSFEPFRMALAIAGIQACLFPYEKNDCGDYATWLRADKGVKDEQTSIPASDWPVIQSRLSSPERAGETPIRIQKRGNLFYP